MRIKNLGLTNFKRFTDLKIDLDPDNSGEIPKLVLLIGANGSGKSCIFDAFSLCSRYGFGQSVIFDGESYYYSKKLDNSNITINGETMFEIKGNNNHDFYNKIGSSHNKGLYKFFGRTAFRYVPGVTKLQLGGSVSRENIKLYEEQKDVFDSNIDILFGSFLKAFGDQDLEVQRSYLSKINLALKNIFGSNSTSLRYNSHNTPVQGVSGFNFIFAKGDSDSIDYYLLSAGEKMVFIILFDLYNNSEKLKDSIVYLDELDLHLNTSIQYSLLKEITENWIPEDSQLWTASHSLGFIDYARKYEKGVIIDLDSLDFDSTQKLVPKQPEEFDVYDIVFSDSNFLKEYTLNRAMKVAISEGEDRKYYGLAKIPNLVFTDEYKDKLNKVNVIKIVKSSNLIGIIDRDFLTDLEIENLKKTNPTLFVTKYNCIENYLYHPDNLAELISNFDTVQYITDITNKKYIDSDEVKTRIGLGRHNYKDYCIGAESQNVTDSLNSSDFEEFYKYYSMKDYCKQLAQRQNLSKEKLASTEWFRDEVLKLVGAFT
jgi:AAA15 family ATPase/GTPase